MKINKKLIIVLGILLLLILLLNDKSYAALQANGVAGTQQTLNDWIVNIRKMEALGGGMGLNENIQANLNPTTQSNNLDIHMEKNTEYGAMAILSASSYGNQNKITNGGTTTGNKTGIVIKFNKELVAAGNNSNWGRDENFLNSVVNMKNAVSKYKNIYNYEKTVGPIFKGDAMTETNGWHGAVNNWYNGSYGNSGYNWRGAIVRAHSGSIFSYYTNNDNGYNGGRYNDICYWLPQYSRAAMVCGEGI